jgi:hypothetical protein
LVITCTITDNSDNGKPIRTDAMIDCGATAIGFIDSDFAQTKSLTLIPLRSPKRIRVVDGRTSLAGPVTHYVSLDLSVSQHTEKSVRFYVTQLGQYNIILGKPWLAAHNPLVDWEKNTLTFRTPHCQRHCLPTGTYQLCVHGLTARPVVPVPSTLPAPHIPPPHEVGAGRFARIADQANTHVFYASLAEICEALEEPIPDDLNTVPDDLNTSSVVLNSDNSDQSLRPTTFLSARAQNYRTMERELARDLPASLCIAGASAEDIEKALAPKPNVDPATKLPSHYHAFLPVFDPQNAKLLPPHRPDDHKIELIPGKSPPAARAYPMSTEELRVLRQYLIDELRKGYIRPSTSPAAAPVLFAKKPGGGLRFCVDYRALNAITIKNRYPLPLIRETLAQLSSAKYFTKLDVTSAFNNIRIADGHEWMTAFMTRYGLYETLVMPFGLTNAPATFQTYINKALHPWLDVFCTAYIDDILIYSNTLEEHREHVRTILQALQKAGLHLDIRKCEFETKEVTYLGMIISDSGVKMDPAKIHAITSWQSPSNLKDVQGFLGFANFYRRFIRGFSRLVRPLVALTHKGAIFKWSPACEQAFQNLKVAFTSAPILRHFDPSREVFIETDASDFVSSGILSQKDDAGILHPVAFMSRKHSEAECNYEIYDKELLAIIRCFEDWRPELEGAAFPITVLSDHRNLEYFMTTKQLSRRQVRWSEFLSQFHFFIRHRPGKQSAKPDALTRRSQDLPADASDTRLQHQNQTLLKEYQLAVLDFQQDLALSPAILDETEEESTEVTIARLLDDGYTKELLPQHSTSTWQRCYMELTKPEGIPHLKDISLSECRIAGNRLYFRDRLYVPDTELRLLLLQLAHDSVETGHPGKNKLYDLLSRDYWWPLLNADCGQFTRNCHGCHRNTTSRLKYQGALKPLPLPAQRWKHISVDFVGPVLTSNGFDTIMVVVDRLSKGRHYVPVHSTMTASELAKCFVKDVWKLHGLPDSIVSDRGSLFVSEFWKAVCHRLRVSVDLSTAYHPESDGQTEIANAYLEQYLRHYIDYSQQDWVEWLPLAEFAANNAVSSSTGITPFFANHGFHPRMSFGPPRALNAAASAHIRQQHTDGTEFASKMEEILDVLRTNLRDAQARYEAFANKTRVAAPAYRVGDMVFLDTRNLTTERLTKKFDHKWIGPFKITRVWTHHYEVALPHELSTIHRRFHTSLLRPAPTDPFPGQYNPPPPPIAIDENGEKLWAIDAILASKRVGRRFDYEILWRGGEKSWEPLHMVLTATASRKEFHKRYPNQPTPSHHELQLAKARVAREAEQARLDAEKTAGTRRTRGKRREKRGT